MSARTIAAAESWRGRWTGPTGFTLDDERMRPGAVGPAADVTLDGTVFPGFRDAHVHLELTDARALYAGGLDEVHDLGAGLEAAATWPSPNGPAAGLPRVRFAGQFLTAPGGYPSDRAWAPHGSVREVTSARDAADAVREQADAGAAFVKLTLNSVAGPVFDDDTLAAVVAAAHATGLRAVAHVEGAGQSARAVAAGVDVLAHTPWTETLDDALIESAARSTVWISTLAIHCGPELDVAVDNLRRFHAAGGTVRYGTDLGNGDLPQGPNASEVRALLAAGLGRDHVVAAMTEGDSAARFAAGLDRITFVPDTPPPNDDDFADWLTRARVVTVTDLQETSR
ncbi:amidohydrolase family protein [Rhodococcus gannanensis]|uniref:Amidohydrolase n=1 Tax=Rhodococcus gannanensis TaxID=1960308 RepID=A0ABW4P0Q0_9NOCA